MFFYLKTIETNPITKNVRYRIEDGNGKCVSDVSIGFAENKDEYLKVVNEFKQLVSDSGIVLNGVR